MISIIGLGGAGNQVANEASKLGFQTGAINFSQRDLESAENVELKLKLVGSEGVGKNRDEAIRLMEKNWELSVNFVKEHFSHPSTQIIVFVFSTGGGSGSGISPILLDILSNEMPNKTFVAMPIIPDTSEVLVNQINCLSTFEQLSELDISIFPIDNEKVKSRFGITGKNRLFEVANSSAMQVLSQIVSYTDKYSSNGNGNIDQNDLLQIFKTKGIGVISSTNIAKSVDGNVELGADAVANKIQQSWDNSVFAPIEYNQLLRAGIIFDGQESLMGYIEYDKIFSKFESMPIDLFEGNYHEQNGEVISVLTGLSWCNSRLSEIERIIEEKRLNAEKAIDSANNQEFKSEATSFNSRIRMNNKPKKSVSDILSKYQR